MIPAQQSNQIFGTAWKLIAGRLPGARTDETDGLVTRFANAPLPFVNISFYNRLIPDLAGLKQVLNDALENAKTCPHPWFHALCEDLAPADWVSVATELSLPPAMKLTGMVAERLAPPTRPLPQFDWCKVEGDHTARDLAVINAHAYSMAPELFDCLFNTRIWQPDTFASVGYLDGQPVTCSAALPVDGTMYLALVATMPGYRARGFAEASIRHTAQYAQAIMGARPLTLHASDVGRPLYSAMGFEPCGAFALLAPVYA